jgi:uncharacterized membrane protein YgaE (UPF0421/DUF939 family)
MPKEKRIGESVKMREILIGILIFFSVLITLLLIKRRGKREDKCDTCSIKSYLLNTRSLERDTIRDYHGRMESLLNAHNHLEIKYMELKDENEDLRKELKKWTGKEVVQFT